MYFYFCSFEMKRIIAWSKSNSDFLLIPDIVTHFDSCLIQSPRPGRTLLTYSKQYEDCLYTYVEEIRNSLLKDGIAVRLNLNLSSVGGDAGGRLTVVYADDHLLAHVSTGEDQDIIICVKHLVISVQQRHA